MTATEPARPSRARRVALGVAGGALVLLAGAFGSRLRAESLLAIGLLPPLATEKIRPVGNAAGLGAWLSLISMPQWDRAAEIAAGTEHVELSGHPAFQSRFIKALDFPPGG